MAGTPLYKWTDKETVTLIGLRSENDHLFTGKKHTAKKAWVEILQQMGLQDRVNPAQAAKKWDNMKRKYKELRRSAAGTGTDSGESTAATWPLFTVMHEAIGGGELIDPPFVMDSCLSENPAQVADEASDVSGSSPHESATATHNQTCVEEMEEAQPFFTHSWTEEENIRLIRLRSENDHLFTGKRNAASKAWAEILRQMGLQGLVSPAQAAKKWDNVKRKYKELRSSAAGTGTDSEESPAATWPLFTAMHEAIGGGELIDPPFMMDSCLAENPAQVADEASDVSGPSPHGSVTATHNQTCVEEMEEAQPFFTHSWTEEENVRLIRLRSENDHLFTGKRNAASKAWAEILRKMGLQGLVSIAQAAKKWDNVKRKYKELRRAATGTGTDSGESPAAIWPLFTAMHEAIGDGESIDPPFLLDLCLAENSAQVADEASDVNGSPTHGSVTGRKMEEAQPFCTHSWTEEENIRLIRLRSENNRLFTGRRNAASKAWAEILRQMGLQGLVSPAQAAKKWDNMKWKYKELRGSATGTGTSRGAAPWPLFTAMHEAIGGGELIDPPLVMDSCLAENPAQVADEASDVSGCSTHESATATHNQTCVEEPQPFCTHSWTEEETIRLIRLRSENDQLFTGKRNAASKAWAGILQQMGLQDLVSPAQAAKKWENMKRKYKELRSSATGTGTDRRESTAATWPLFTAMHEAIGGGELIDPPFVMDLCLSENPAQVADEASDVSGPSPHESATATHNQTCVEEMEEAQPFCTHSWTEEETIRLIRLRSENDHLFTGKRNAATKAWADILQQMGLQDLVSPAQAAKKWENMKRKYKELRSSATGTGTDRGEPTAATWPLFTAMHEAISRGESRDPLVQIDSCPEEDFAYVDDEDSDASGSCPGSVTASGSVVCVEVGEGELEEELEEEVEVELEEELEEEDDGDDNSDAQPGLSNLKQEDDDECTSACPPSPKRRRTRQGAILEFLKEEATKEEERFQAAMETTNRFLDLFEQLVDKLARKRKAAGRPASAVELAALEFFKTGPLPKGSDKNVYSLFPSLGKQYVRKALLEGQSSSGSSETPASTAPASRPMSNDKAHAGDCDQQHRLPEDSEFREESPHLTDGLSRGCDLQEKHKQAENLSHLSTNGSSETPASTAPASRPMSNDKAHAGDCDQQHRLPEDNELGEESSHLTDGLSRGCDLQEKHKQAENLSRLSTNGTLNILSDCEVTLHPTRLHEDYCTPQSVQWADGVWKKADCEFQFPSFSMKVPGKWEWLSMDVRGPLPETLKGHRFLLIVMDLYSRWTEVRPMRTSSAREVALNIRNLVCQLGLPHTLFSQLSRVFLRAVNKALGIYMAMEDCGLLVFHPKACSLDPSTYTDVSRMVMKLVQDHRESWDMHLRSCLFALRTKQHPDTGESPFYTLYHRNPRYDDDDAAPQKLPVGLSDDHPISRILASLPLTDTQEPHPSRVPASLQAQMPVSTLIVLNTIQSHAAARGAPGLKDEEV